jgi:hypothetical protein
MHPEQNFLLILSCVCVQLLHSNVLSRFERVIRFGGNKIYRLVGTKVDLYMSDVPKEQLVSLEEAQETARRNKLAGYLQLSSLADRGVQEMFHTALRLCWRFGGTNPEGSHETGNRKCAIQ